MGRHGITQEDVFSAAKAIAAKGYFPTTKAIRNIIGSGSITTIHKHLQEWKRQRIIDPYMNHEHGHAALKLIELQQENTALKLQLQEYIRRRQGRKINLFRQLASYRFAVFKNLFYRKTMVKSC